MYNLGTGAIKDKKDKRDYKYSDAVVALGIEPFDWSVGYNIEQILGLKLEVKNQNGSGSCGGQAWSYYGQALDPHEEKSAKFIYAQTFIPPAGSAGRDNCELVIKKGWGTEALTVSYEAGHAPSEAFMQRKSDITEEAYNQALTEKALSYAQVTLNIDSIAQAVRENKGCIIGITGVDNGSWRTAFPIPFKNGDRNAWNHWLYVGKLKIINGKKHLGVINSWGTTVGEKGWQWLSEDHMPFIWSAWTLVKDFPKFQFTKTLKLYSTDPEVKELQRRLGVVTTGFFFTLTKLAVQKYQKSKGLVPDGIVGPLTRAELNK